MLRTNVKTERSHNGIEMRLASSRISRTLREVEGQANVSSHTSSFRRNLA